MLRYVLSKYKFIVRREDKMQLFRASVTMLHQQNLCDVFKSLDERVFRRRLFSHGNLYSRGKILRRETLLGSCKFARAIHVQLCIGMIEQVYNFVFSREVSHPFPTSEFCC